jgi:hypothetical protein
MTSAICHLFPILFPNMPPVTGTIAIAQPLLNFFNKDPFENVYLVIMHKKTWYFSESITIDVRCRWAKMSSHLLRHVILASMREKYKIL